MIKSATIRARTDLELKTEVEDIFKSLGLNASDAINLFYYQVRLHKGLPFEVKLPNKTTLKTFQKTNAGLELVKCNDVNDMFRKLGI
jgi:DNA-damage-inducible protein J